MLFYVSFRLSYLAPFLKKIPISSEEKIGFYGTVPQQDFPQTFPIFIELGRIWTNFVEFSGFIEVL